jgi:hypothetical protein
MMAGSRPAILAIEWTLATTAALVLSHLAIEIAGAAVLGYAFLLLLPFIGGVLGLPVGALQWLVLRRQTDGDDPWILFTFVGFVGASIVAAIAAAALFVPYTGLSGPRTFVSLAIASPVIGWSQSRVVRRWNADVRLWMVASALGWSGCAAVAIFRHHELPDVDRLAGRMISAVAGFPVESSVGATLVGGAMAGVVTGLALVRVLRTRRLER